MIGSVVRIGQPPPPVARNLTDREIWNALGLTTIGGIAYYLDKQDLSLLLVPALLMFVFCVFRDGDAQG